MLYPRLCSFCRQPFQCVRRSGAKVYCSLKCQIYRRLQTGGPSECWLWRGSTTPFGYGILHISTGVRVVHRLMYEMVHGQAIPIGKIVRHKCDVPRCCNPDHLELGTQQDNVRDRAIRGRTCRGENIAAAKLTEEQVMKILKDTRAQRTIAAEYGVNHAAIGCIKRCYTWKHIYEAYHASGTGANTSV